jgi:hypothetical protein
MTDNVLSQNQSFIDEREIYFFRNLKECINLLENWLPVPSDLSQIDYWIESAEKIINGFDFTDKESEYVDNIIDKYEEIWKYNIQNKQQYSICQNDIPSDEFLEGLINRKQIEQRTEEWYKHMTQILSASELGKLFASPRIRAQLVVSKTQPYIPRQNSLAVPSSSMSAFDWGIRFEPVVKQIYEYKYSVEVRDLGRLTHPIDQRCSASPDGLVYICNKNNDRKGRLIEIKCPVTREIDGQVPKDYYAQMQMQLQVTGCKKCDYIEAQFSSQYNTNPIKYGPGLYNGYIALVRYAEPTYDKEFYYIYSNINQDDGPDNWYPDIKDDNDEIIEIIPWSLLQWSEQIVERNEEWWQGIQPAINNFWDDVEKAKRGEFIIPESTRPKKQKEESCAIVFNRLDENGNPC